MFPQLQILQILINKQECLGSLVLQFRFEPSKRKNYLAPEIQLKSIRHFFFFWYYSQVPALIVPMMLLHFSLSLAVPFHMPTPLLLRSSSTLSSHLLGGHPTLLVPFNVLKVKILQEWFFVSPEEVFQPSYSSGFYN